MSAVHKPDHYTIGGIESIDYIAAKLGPEGFRAFCIGNLFKYASRYQYKDGEQDLAKALVYLQWAIAKAPIRDSAPVVHDWDDAPCYFGRMIGDEG